MKYTRHSSEPGMLLDIASYARCGPGRRDRLSSAEIEVIARTVSRTPEVMVKVLTRGGQNLGAVRRHLAYLNRGGELELETDDGERLTGKGIETDLLNDWDLDLDEHRRRADLGPRTDRRSPKLVHKILFSMPPGTPPDKVLAAVKNFAREEFAFKHRYTMVLHTDEAHPHVHMVVKAMSEQGVRLHIRKATLRHWRKEFARHLREQDIAANATERAVRGESTTPKRDPIFRATLRGASTHARLRVDNVARQILAGAIRADPGTVTLLECRRAVVAGWRAVSDILTTQSHPTLAARAKQFVAEMAPPLTENEQLAQHLARHLPTRGSQDYEVRHR